MHVFRFPSRLQIVIDIECNEFGEKRKKIILLVPLKSCDLIRLCCCYPKSCRKASSFLSKDLGKFCSNCKSDSLNHKGHSNWLVSQ